MIYRYIPLILLSVMVPVRASEPERLVTSDSVALYRQGMGDYNNCYHLCDTRSGRLLRNLGSPKELCYSGSSIVMQYPQTFVALDLDDYANEYEFSLPDDGSNDVSLLSCSPGANLIALYHYRDRRSYLYERSSNTIIKEFRWDFGSVSIDSRNIVYADKKDDDTGFAREIEIVDASVRPVRTIAYIERLLYAKEIDDFSVFVEYNDSNNKKIVTVVDHARKKARRFDESCFKILTTAFGWIVGVRNSPEEPLTDDFTRIDFTVEDQVE